MSPLQGYPFEHVLFEKNLYSPFRDKRKGGKKVQEKNWCNLRFFYQAEAANAGPLEKEMGKSGKKHQPRFTARI